MTTVDDKQALPNRPPETPTGDDQAPAKNKFERKREATYQQLIEAGMRLMHERGYTQTRASDIASATGHTTGAFYFHFRNKEDFFLHVLRHRERLRTDWQHLALELDPATTTLEQLLTLTLRDLRERMHGMLTWTPVTVGFHHHTKNDPQMEMAVRAIHKRWLDEIETFVKALQQKRWIAPDRDTRELAIQLFSLADGHATQALIYSSHNEPALLHGLLKLLQ